MAVPADLDIKIGDEFVSERWGVVVAGVAVDLTQGWTVRAQIRRRPEDAAALHTFAAPVGVRLTAPVVNGEDVVPSTVQLYAAPATTQLFTPWTAVWDLEIEHPTYGLGGGPYRKTVLSGIARTTWDVTRG